MDNSNFLDIILADHTLLLHGLLTTLVFSAVIILVSIVLGTFLGVLRFENPLKLGKLATLYIEGIRSIPLILFIVLVHYGIMPLLVHRPPFILSSLIAFSLFEGAYMAEIIRGGLRSIHTEEREAAVSLGLSYPQRYLFVFLPLAFTRALPGLMNQSISLIKDTSLASVVGVIELTRAGEIIYERAYHDLEMLLLLACVYFTICYGLSLFSRRFESRQNSFGSASLETLQL